MEKAIPLAVKKTLEKLGIKTEKTSGTIQFYGCISGCEYIPFSDEFFLVKVCDYVISPTKVTLQASSEHPFNRNQLSYVKDGNTGIESYFKWFAYGAFTHPEEIPILLCLPCDSEVNGVIHTTGTYVLTNGGNYYISKVEYTANFQRSIDQKYLPQQEDYISISSKKTLEKLGVNDKTVLLDMLLPPCEFLNYGSGKYGNCEKQRIANNLLELGKTYTVILDDVQYNHLSASPFSNINVTGCIAIGDSGFLNNSAYDARMPFLVVQQNDGVVDVVFKTSDTHTMSIYEDTVGNTPIDPSMIPFTPEDCSSLATTQTLKTLGIEDKTVVDTILPEQAPTPHPEFGFTLDFAPEAGKVYTVVVNGVKYQEEAKEIDLEGEHAIILGNGMYFGLGYSETPWYIGYMPSMSMCMIAFMSGGSEPTVAIYTERIETTPIDQKYLPGMCLPVIELTPENVDDPGWSCLTKAESDKLTEISKTHLAFLVKVNLKKPEVFLALRKWLSGDTIPVYEGANPFSDIHGYRSVQLLGDDPNEWVMCVYEYK